MDHNAIKNGISKNARKAKKNKEKKIKNNVKREALFMKPSVASRQLRRIILVDIKINLNFRFMLLIDDSIPKRFIEKH